MIEALVLGIASLALVLPSRFLGSFSYEFNAVLGIATFFVFFAGALFRLFRWRSILPMFFALLVPPLIALAFAWKNPTCRWGVGFAWYGLLPCVSAVFAIASARLGHRFSKSVWTAALIGLAPTLFSLAWVAFDLYARPSLFLFHPAFGYFPGPLYDEWIPILPKVVTFRVWTLLLSGALWWIARDGRGRWGLLFLILAPLMLRSSLGWNYSHADLRRALPERVVRGPMTLHYASSSFSPDSADRYAETLSFYVEDVAHRWELGEVTPFDVYVYPDAATKGELTGTRDTAIGHPLQRALHILKESPASSILPHELSHVLSGQFGPRPFRMPMNQALLEGLATSIEGFRGNLSIHEWAKAMAELGKLPSPRDLFRPWGFFSQSPFRAYLASGSFLRWLTERSGASAVKAYYAGQPFRTAFGISLDEANEGWRAFLRDVPLFPKALEAARLALESKAIFERRCPHDVADALGRRDACAGSVPCALGLSQRAYAHSGKDPWVALALARDLLRANRAIEARAILDAIPDLGRATPQLRSWVDLAKGDAAVLVNHPASAPAHYEAAAREPAPESMLRVARARLALLRGSKTDLLRTWILDRLPDAADLANVDLAYLSLAQSLDDTPALRAAIQKLPRQARRTYDESLLLVAAHERLMEYDRAIELLSKARPTAQTLGQSDRIEREVRRLNALKHRSDTR